MQKFYTMTALSQLLAVASAATEGLINNPAIEASNLRHIDDWRQPMPARQGRLIDKKIAAGAC